MFKKITSFVVLFFILLGITNGVFAALSNKEKGVLLEKFNKKQEEFIFKNDLNVDTLDALDLFKSNNKINIYENVLKNVGEEKRKLQEENVKIIKKIDDLQYQLNSLEKDIKTLEDETKKINANIIQTTVRIKQKESEIEKTKEQIEKNTDILRKYIAHIYKKGNLFLDNGKLDNLKAILLSGDNLDEVVNDIYFKELLSIAGKRLIQKHRKYIVKLYVEKKKLESETTTLKKLRKTFALKKKILKDKKAFKEKILEISKGKESLYKKYIKDKIKVETSLKLKTFAERMKFYNTSKKLLGKQGCKFVDVSKNTPESRTLSEKCYKLNKIVSLEAKLEDNRLKNKDKENNFNVFSWPVSPFNGISAYFHDKNYKKEFNVDHLAIDIKAPQGTNIKAPKDGYVLQIKKPIDNGYAYIVLKHSDGFVTAYGHIFESTVEQYDYVKKGDIIGKTGGTFGTPGAGYITTGPHLHFEIWKDKVAVDPLKYMDLSYLNFKLLPEAYKLDFFIDYKNRTGKEFLTKEKFTGRVFTLEGNSEIERQKSLLRKYARSDFADWNMWVEEALRWNVDPTFIMCIGLAESGLGRNLKTSYNVGNVGNVDSGGTWTMQSPRQGIWWIGHTLNNKYLRKYNKISQLSGYGRKGNAPIYASSKINWHRNVIKCMSAIKQQYVPDDYNFRTY